MATLLGLVGDPSLAIMVVRAWGTIGRGASRVLRSSRPHRPKSSASRLIAQLFAFPLHGLWVVLTATMVTQLSVGGSLRAGLEYVLGTLGGALYAGIVGVLIAPANSARDVSQCSIARQHKE